MLPGITRDMRIQRPGCWKENKAAKFFGATIEGKCLDQPILLSGISSALKMAISKQHTLCKPVLEKFLEEGFHASVLDGGNRIDSIAAIFNDEIEILPGSYFIKDPFDEEPTTFQIDIAVKTMWSDLHEDYQNLILDNKQLQIVYYEYQEYKDMYSVFEVCNSNVTMTDAEHRNGKNTRVAHANRELEVKYTDNGVLKDTNFPVEIKSWLPSQYFAGMKHASRGMQSTVDNEGNYIVTKFPWNTSKLAIDTDYEFGSIANVETVCKKEQDFIMEFMRYYEAFQKQNLRIEFFKSKITLDFLVVYTIMKKHEIKLRDTKSSTKADVLKSFNDWVHETLADEISEYDSGVTNKATGKNDMLKFHQLYQGQKKPDVLQLYRVNRALKEWLPSVMGTLLVQSTKREYISDMDKVAAFNKNNGTDVMTGKKFSLTDMKNMELDHDLPLKLGGKNSIDNLNWITKTANRKKGSSDLTGFTE